MSKIPKLVANLPQGTRVEVWWDDAYTLEDGSGPSLDKTSIRCYDLGYFDRLDRDGIRIWREIDEHGDFRWEMNIARPSIVKVRRLGPPPRRLKPQESA